MVLAPSRISAHPRLSAQPRIRAHPRIRAYPWTYKIKKVPGRIFEAVLALYKIISFSSGVFYVTHPSYLTCSDQSFSNPDHCTPSAVQTYAQDLQAQTPTLLAISGGLHSENNMIISTVLFRSLFSQENVSLCGKENFWKILRRKWEIETNVAQFFLV